VPKWRVPDLVDRRGDRLPQAGGARRVLDRRSVTNDSKATVSVLYWYGNSKKAAKHKRIVDDLRILLLWRNSCEPGDCFSLAESLNAVEA